MGADGAGGSYGGYEEGKTIYIKTDIKTISTKELKAELKKREKKKKKK